MDSSHFLKYLIAEGFLEIAAFPNDSVYTAKWVKSKHINAKLEISAEGGEYFTIQIERKKEKHFFHFTNEFLEKYARTFWTEAEVDQFILERNRLRDDAANEVPFILESMKEIV